MPTSLEQARAYLDAMEADRRAALALSEQKAEEAKLIKARQEGFQAAMDILGGAISVGNAESVPKEPRRRRGRRPIRQLILRELSFSGQTMTATQIAKAIDYNLERTEIALERMEKSGQVLRNEQGRWTIGITATAQPSGPAVASRNGEASSTVGALDD
jgi:predicted transcriptional regulator